MDRTVRASLNRRLFLARLGASAAAAAGVALLAACGGSPAAAPATAPAAGAAPTSAPAAGATAAAPTVAPAGGATPTAATGAAATPTIAVAAAPTSAPVAAATATPASAAAATVAPAAGASGLKVGLVTDIGQINDKSFNQSAWMGVQQAQQQLGVQAQYIETKTPNDYAANIAQFIGNKYDVIVTVGFLLQDATLAAAKANANVKFIGVDQAYGNTAPPNLAGLIFQEDKAGFLAGALAAGMSKSHKVASVLGTKSVPPVVRYGEGYVNGAKYLAQNFGALTGNQSVDGKLVYHADGNNAFTDPAWGADQAKSLIQSGYDVIFGAGGKTGNGAIEAAADQGTYVIGVDDDQYLTLASEDPKITGKILSSAVKKITPGVFTIVQNITSSSFKSGDNVGTVGLAPYHDLDSAIPQPLKDALTKITTGLDDGSIKTGVSVS